MMFKALLTTILLIFLTSCASLSPKNEVTIYTTVYPPYTVNSDSGLLIEIIREAYKTQGITVKFLIDDIENALEDAIESQSLVLASRDITHKNIMPNPYFIEIYSATAYAIGISKNKSINLTGVYSFDEEEYAKANNLAYIKYSSYAEGLKLLYENKISQLFCSDIGCEQIKITNPEINFYLKDVYDFPFDVVFYGDTIPESKKFELNALHVGMKNLLRSGKYLKLLDSYKVKNPLFQISLEYLMNIESIK